jgi:DNA-binding phage protein
LPSWIKLGDGALELLYQEFIRNRPNKAWLARKYGISRPTLYRYLRMRGLR